MEIFIIGVLSIACITLSISLVKLFKLYNSLKSNYHRDKEWQTYMGAKEQHQVRLLFEKVIDYDDYGIGEISFGMREIDGIYYCCVIAEADGSTYVAAIDPFHDSPINVINYALEVAKWAEHESRGGEDQRPYFPTERITDRFHKL